jgi:uncharacterized protein (TIGR03000 family)
MRLNGIRAAICASVVALAMTSTASAWNGYYGWGGWYGGYWPSYGWSGYYGYSPGYWNGYYSYYPYSYSSYYPYSYYSYYPYSYYSPTYYTPTYPVSNAVVAAPASSTYQSFYPPEAAVSPPAGDEAVVVVRTAPDAQLWFDGVATSQSGGVRAFSTPDLRRGKSYKYDVKVRWTENGNVMERTRSVTVSAGDKIELDLTPANLRNG